MALVRFASSIPNGVNYWDADKLERKKVAEYLTPLIIGATPPFVMSLTADYGSGKSFFVECWRRDLETCGIATVYFNSWETDFSKDPLFAFISAMRRQLKPLRGADQKFTEAAKAAGGLMLKKLAPIGLQITLRTIFGSDIAKQLLNLSKSIEDDLAKEAGKLAEQSLKSQESAENSLKEFRNFLGTALEDVVSDKKDESLKKIVVFVDELDRCRPDYAISVLECIKHLFNVKGLIFVLSVDARFLHQAIAAVYGPELDADGYLRRFIDARFQLPLPSSYAFTHFLARRHFVRADQSHPRFGAYSINRSVFHFTNVARHYGLSLRTIEQCFVELKLCEASYKKSPSSHPVAPELLWIVCALRSSSAAERMRAMFDGREDPEIFAEELAKAYLINDEAVQLLDSFSDNKFDPATRLKLSIHGWFSNWEDRRKNRDKILSLENEYRSRNKDDFELEHKLAYQRFLKIELDKYQEFYRTEKIPYASPAYVACKMLDELGALLTPIEAADRTPFSLE